MSHRQRTLFRRLFRSLEIAFHAGMYPADGLLSINDVGVRLALWVSAFEVLFHPGGAASVNKRVVQTALGKIRFATRELNAQRYSVTYNKQTYKGNVVEAIYDDLYRARCLFLHGSPVSRNDLHYQRSGRLVQLLVITPVIYNVSLLGFLQGVIPGAPDEPLEDWRDDAQMAAWIRRQSGIKEVQRALAAVRHPVP
jgi:hypothetical protein